MKSRAVRTIFIFAYYSYNDPVFQSAVLPYFLNFPEKEKFKFVLLTFEQKKFRTDKQKRKGINDFLSSHNIVWYNQNWHSGRFKLIKKLYDFLAGVFRSLILIRKHKADIIYSEGFPGMILGHYLSKISGRSHVIHTFEPHADYMVDAGVWSEKSWETRIIKFLETRILNHASYVFTATNKMVDLLKAKLTQTKTQVSRMPSCVDTEIFKFNPVLRKEIRAKHNILEDDKVIVYLGKFGGMYLKEETFDFFSYLYNQGGRKYKFFVFTDEEKSWIQNAFKERGVPESHYVTSYLKKEEVPNYLSASDWAFCGVRQISSQRFSSPIKNGEYWACGLPLIIPKGISDDYLFSKEYEIGLVLEDLTENSFKNVFTEMNVFEENWKKEKAVSFVIKDRKVSTYQEVYKQVFLN